MADEPRDRPFILQWRSAVLNSAMSGTQKLCLLTLAEWADADGSNCFPAMTSVAAKASVNEKTVRRSMDQVEALGWIRRRQEGTKQGWRRFAYTPIIPKGADTLPARSDKGAGTESAPQQATCGQSVHDVRTLSPEGAGTKSTDLAITYPVTKERQNRSRKKNEQTFEQWMESVRYDEEKAIPPGDPIFTFADEAGISRDFLYLAWRWFCQRYRDDSKTYRDWRAVFRRAIREDWHRCWRHDKGLGQMVLTNVGMQLQTQLEAQDREAA